MRIKGLIPVIAGLMLLIVLGSALAMWYDTLKIKATISTGDVDVKFGKVDSVENDHGKDVANCHVELMEIEDEDSGNPYGDNDLDLNITIENGYPSYWCNVTFTVNNTGTIPVKGPYSNATGTLSPFSDRETLDDGVEILYELTPTQIDPGKSATFTIKIHILQGAKESYTYNHQVELYFVQWNEAPS
mgnify:CR=1 FL=1